MNERAKNIKADWSKFERRPTWSIVSSRELSEALGVSLNTICNWRMRKILPEPFFHPQLKGNKVYYRISALRAWLEGRAESEIHWEWLETHFDIGTPFSSLKQAEEVVILCWDVYGVEKPVIPGNFNDADRNPRFDTPKLKGVDHTPTLASILQTTARPQKV